MKYLIDYNIYDYIRIVKENLSIKENYTKSKDSSKIVNKDLTTSIVVLSIAIFSLILWIIALVLTIKKWKVLNKNKRIICIIFLLLTWSTIPILSPILSPIIVLITLYSSNIKYKYSKNKKIKNKK
jgi:hypothetical protein